MRVAFVGKGGTGKSVLAGTFARLAARQGRAVLALDSDPLPGLAYSLGVPHTDAGIPDDAVEERPDGAGGPPFRLRAGLDAAAAVDAYAAVAPDGVRFLQFGKLRGHVSALIRSQHAFRQIVDELPAARWDLVGDLPGGTRQPFFGWASFADTVVVVVEPTAASMLAGRRLAGLAEGPGPPTEVVAVVNKARAPDDAEVVASRTGLEVVGVVPWDEAVGAADRDGLPVLDTAPDAPAVRAVESLLERLGGEQPA